MRSCILNGVPVRHVMAENPTSRGGARVVAWQRDPGRSRFDASPSWGCPRSRQRTSLISATMNSWRSSLPERQGVVFQATQRSLDPIVALKLLLGGQHASQDLKKRFRQEAEVAAKCSIQISFLYSKFGEHVASRIIDGICLSPNLSTVLAISPLPPGKPPNYVKNRPRSDLLRARARQ